MPSTSHLNLEQIIKEGTKKVLAHESQRVASDKLPQTQDRPSSETEAKEFKKIEEQFAIAESQIKNKEYDYALCTLRYVSLAIKKLNAVPTVTGELESRMNQLRKAANEELEKMNLKAFGPALGSPLDVQDIDPMSKKFLFSPMKVEKGGPEYMNPRQMDAAGYEPYVLSIEDQLGLKYRTDGNDGGKKHKADDVKQKVRIRVGWRKKQ